MQRSLQLAHSLSSIWQGGSSTAASAISAAWALPGLISTHPLAAPHPAPGQSQSQGTSTHTAPAPWQHQGDQHGPSPASCGHACHEQHGGWGPGRCLPDSGLAPWQQHGATTPLNSPWPAHLNSAASNAAQPVTQDAHSLGSLTSPQLQRECNSTWGHMQHMQHPWRMLAPQQSAHAAAAAAVPSLQSLSHLPVSLASLNHALQSAAIRCTSVTCRSHGPMLPTWPVMWGNRHLSTASNGTGSSSSTSNSSGSGRSAAAQPGPSGVLAALPASWLPYAQLMRLDKPIGTWLLLWPSLWSIALAAPAGQLPDLWIMSLFSIGALLLRGAGCTINDLWDRDLDGKVERTRTRPLASGALQPWQAVALLGGQLSLGLCILLQLNTYSQVLGASSLLLVGAYPLMKRVTDWPQAFLGLTINWGALLGWAAVRGSCDWGVVLPLYAAGVCWSLVYDTVYAHQDKHDDVAAGVRSTALLFGPRTKPVLAGFAALQLAALTAAGAAAGVGPAYYAGVAGMGAHLARQLTSVNLDNGPHCAATFMSNKWAGAILFAGCVAGRLMP